MWDLLTKIYEDHGLLSVFSALEAAVILGLCKIILVLWRAHNKVQEARLVDLKEYEKENSNEAF